MKFKQTRLTRQKKAIGSWLEKRDGHYPAEEIFQQVRRQIKNISLATVYRNLEQMSDQGMIDLVYIAGRPKWFERKKFGSHGHLFCRQCNGLQDVVDCQLCFTKNRCAQENNFQAEEIDFIVTGLCDKCRGGKVESKL